MFLNMIYDIFDLTQYSSFYLVVRFDLISMKIYSHKHILIVIIILLMSFVVFRSVNKNEPVPGVEIEQTEAEEHHDSDC